MISKVTERGVFLPAKLLGRAKEVEIRQEKGRLVIIPLPENDPIEELGSNPVSCGVPDASTHHDEYLYGAKEK